MKSVYLVSAATALILAGCEGPVGSDKSNDFGLDARSAGQVRELKWGIWIDPNGCDHWIIDDGVEGYMDARRAPDGAHVCSGVGEPTQVVGPFKENRTIADIF